TVTESSARAGDMAWVTVNWGDGAAGASGAAGSFDIATPANPSAATAAARHTYQDEGTYTVTVSAISSDGQSAKTTTSVTVDEADVFTTPVSIVAIPSLTENVAPSVAAGTTLATFTNTGYPLQTASGFTATIVYDTNNAASTSQ